jgi:hypothetical protein
VEDIVMIQAGVVEVANDEIDGAWDAIDGAFDNPSRAGEVR